jgi:hypothetical protein
VSKQVAIAALAVLAIMATFFAASLTVTSAVSSCIPQISTPYVTTSNPYSNIEVRMPVSATCSFSGGQLYAVGDAFDISTGTPLGSVISTLPSISKSNRFYGQLVFIIPAVDRGHPIQFTVSVYSDPSNVGVNFSNEQQIIWNGQLLGTTSAPPLVVPEFPVSTAIIMTTVLFGALIFAKFKQKSSVI